MKACISVLILVLGLGCLWQGGLCPLPARAQAESSSGGAAGAAPDQPVQVLGPQGQDAAPVTQGAGGGAAAAEPLKGRVEEETVAPVRPAPVPMAAPMPMPVVPLAPLAPQQPRLDDNVLGALSGRVGAGGMPSSAAAGTELIPGTGVMDTQFLRGSAVKDDQLGEADPDSNDQELAIEWDRWRNRFLRAVQLGVQENVNNPEPEEATPRRFDPATGMMLPRFPLGISVWFYCQVLPDRSIKNILIIKPSGYPSYDAIVRRAVKELAGRQMLDYPRGSHRKVVVVTHGLRTSTTGDFTYYKFGDVERYSVPGGR